MSNRALFWSMFALIIGNWAAISFIGFLCALIATNSVAPALLLLVLVPGCTIIVIVNIVVVQELVRKTLL